MRRIFTPEGKLDVAQQQLPEQPDEVLTKMTKLRMERWPNETFMQAKHEILREDPALAGVSTTAPGHRASGNDRQAFLPAMPRLEVHR